MYVQTLLPLLPLQLLPLLPLLPLLLLLLLLLLLPLLLLRLPSLPPAGTGVFPKASQEVGALREAIRKEQLAQFTSEVKGVRE